MDPRPETCETNQQFCGKTGKELYTLFSRRLHRDAQASINDVCCYTCSAVCLLTVCLLVTRVSPAKQLTRSR